MERRQALIQQNDHLYRELVKEAKDLEERATDEIKTLVCNHFNIDEEMFNGSGEKAMQYEEDYALLS